MYVLYFETATSAWRSSRRTSPTAWCPEKPRPSESTGRSLASKFYTDRLNKSHILCYTMRKLQPHCSTKAGKQQRCPSVSQRGSCICNPCGRALQSFGEVDVEKSDCNKRGVGSGEAKWLLKQHRHLLATFGKNHSGGIWSLCKVTFASYFKWKFWAKSIKTIKSLWQTRCKEAKSWRFKNYDIHFKMMMTINWIYTIFLRHLSTLQRSLYLFTPHSHWRWQSGVSNSWATRRANTERFNKDGTVSRGLIFI